MEEKEITINAAVLAYEGQLKEKDHAKATLGKVKVPERGKEEKVVEEQQEPTKEKDGMIV